MVAVDTRGDCCRGKTAGHELQQSHLGGGILHGHAIRLELEVGHTPDVLAIVCVGQQGLLRVVEMRVQNLLGERQLPPGSKHAAHLLQASEELLVRRHARGNVDIMGSGHIVGRREASSLAVAEGRE
jgi:hypothetical protein